jgi:altronate dehydratase small subunit
MPEDNVATLIDDAAAGPVELVGAVSGVIAAREGILRGHKVAVRPIGSNEAVIKYGVRIGHATQTIQLGAWVHLHNLASDLDERSGTLELHTGVPTDTSSAYV